MTAIRRTDLYEQFFVPRLHITPLDQLLEDLGEKQCEACPSLKLIDSRLPLLHFTSCTDFDDGLGTLVLGSTEGICTVLKFIVDCSFPVQDSLYQELPSKLTSVQGISLSAFPQAKEVRQNIESILPLIIFMFRQH